MGNVGVLIFHDAVAQDGHVWGRKKNMLVAGRAAGERKCAGGVAQIAEECSPPMVAMGRVVMVAPAATNWQRVRPIARRTLDFAGSASYKLCSTGPRWAGSSVWDLGTSRVRDETMLKRIALGMMLPALLAASVWAADIKLEGVKCLVAGSKAASKEQSADHKGGKVFFCCGNCKKAFETSPAKFAVKANHQLVVTGQAKQTKCPLSGIACKEDKVVDVAGAKVYFCCENCQGKVASAKGDEQAELVFSDKAFEKAGFKVGK